MTSDEKPPSHRRHHAGEPGYWLHPSKGVHQLKTGQEHSEFFKAHPELFGDDLVAAFADGWVSIRRWAEEDKWALRLDEYEVVRGLLQRWAAKILAAHPEEGQTRLSIFGPSVDTVLPGTLCELAAVSCAAGQHQGLLEARPATGQEDRDRERESIGMNYYLAYGSNMNPVQMAQRCTSAEALGVASLPGYRFIINERGVANLRADTEAETPGVLWRISEEDERALDACEAHRKCVYDKCYRSVHTADGRSFGAVVYIDHRHQTLQCARSFYMERIIQGAEHHGLPERHVQMLRAWPSKEGFKTFNRVLSRIHAGVDVEPKVRQHRAEIVRRLRPRHDALILEALQYLRAQSMPGDFERGLESLILESAQELAEVLHDEYRQRLTARYGELSRLNAQVEDLLGENRYLEVIRCADMSGEIAAQGIIVTSEADRPHADDDRFILTPHAPAIAAAWEAVADGWHEALPVAWEFLPVYIDAVAGLGEDGDVSNAVLDGLEKLRHAVRKALVGEALARAMDLE
jgi:cation transport regulator ChaC